MVSRQIEVIQWIARWLKAPFQEVLQGKTLIQ